MIREVIRILRKHLDYAEVAYEAMWEAVELTPFDVLREFPDYNALRKLARELIITIKGEDVSKLIKVPSQEEMEFLVKMITPGKIADDTDFVSYHARFLRAWLADTGQFGEKHTVSDVIRMMRCLT